MFRASLAAGVVLAASVHIVLAAKPSTGQTDPALVPLERWREGPVRYIITAEEDREFQRLDSTEDRLRFIERFWARRDPDNRTLLNEYRRTFWDRVVAANGLFSVSSKPGWKTDMGRYYILLGPPDDRDTSMEQGIAYGQTGIRGAIRWLYRRAPTDRIGTGLEIVFVRDALGEYSASTDPAVVERVRASSLFFPGTDATAFGLPLPQFPARVTELQLLLDLGRLEEVPSVEDLLTEIVTASEFFGEIPFSSRYDFFSDRRGGAIAALTVNVHPDPFNPHSREQRPDYMIVGRLDHVEAEQDGGEVAAPLFLREDDFHPSPHNDDPDFHGPYVYQTVVRLRPGTYDVSFAAFERETRTTGTYTDTIRVPSFSERVLSLSSLCLSEEIEPATSAEGAAEPYVFGHLKITPRLRPTYRNGDTFAVYYQVYGAELDPVTSRPDLDIEYQFLVRQADDYIPIGQPIRFDDVTYPAQGWSFPLRDWPAADFRLQVKVTDAIGGQSTSSEIEFTVL